MRFLHEQISYFRPWPYPAPKPALGEPRQSFLHAAPRATPTVALRPAPVPVPEGQLLNRSVFEGLARPEVAQAAMHDEPDIEVASGADWERTVSAAMLLRSTWPHSRMCWPPSSPPRYE